MAAPSASFTDGVYLFSKVGCTFCDLCKPSFFKFAKWFETQQKNGVFAPSFVLKHSVHNAHCPETAQRTGAFPEEYGFKSYPALVFIVHGRAYQPGWFAYTGYRKAPVFSFAALVTFALTPILSQCKRHRQDASKTIADGQKLETALMQTFDTSESSKWSDDMLMHWPRFQIVYDEAIGRRTTP